MAKVTIPEIPPNTKILTLKNLTLDFNVSYDKMSCVKNRSSQSRAQGFHVIYFNIYYSSKFTIT